jgi:crossover junction endodeoxyribonuclease RuvC
VTILGIDPSLRRTGWAVLESNTGSLEVAGAGSIPFPRSKGKRTQEKELEMLSIVYDSILDIASRFMVSAYSIELPPPVCRRGAQKLQQVVGAIKAALGANNVTTGAEYYPSTIKLTIGGHGNAEKAQVSEGVAKLLTYPWDFKNHDESDAAALALTYWIKLNQTESKNESKRKQNMSKKPCLKLNKQTNEENTTVASVYKRTNYKNTSSKTLANF